MYEYEKKAWEEEVRRKKSGKTASYAAVKDTWGREPWLDGASDAAAAATVAEAAATAVAVTTVRSRGGARHGRTGANVMHALAIDHGSGPAAGRRRGSELAQRDGRRWRVRMRCSSGLPLAAVLHAENSTLHPSPTCTMCEANTDETQAHVMSECARYAEARADLTAAAIKAAVQGGGDGQAAPRLWHDANHHHRTVKLLQADSPPALVAAVHVYLHRVFMARAAVMRTRAEVAAAAAAAAALATTASMVGAARPGEVSRPVTVPTRERAGAGARAMAMAQARGSVPAERAVDGDGMRVDGVGSDHDIRDDSVRGRGVDLDQLLAAAAAGDGREDQRCLRTPPAEQGVRTGAGGMCVAMAAVSDERCEEWPRVRARSRGMRQEEECE